MSEFTRALITAAIQDRGPAWEATGTQWQITTGPKTDKPSVWVTCENTHNLAQLTIWSSGEAELDLGHPTDDATTSIHYDLATHEDLATRLGDLTDLLNRRPTASNP
ncbi:hypothetical protein ACFQY7_39820 [Actinomadura luteofluorescens]|uniref:Uncharacterized protein n=1 Tax=Actinomadura luteofluorescens TaxID=46163 RepID=A0A7Y9EIA9_9ACTN|nr:hypothetical protein [Actinomadura luteofluorescens]NYD48254.1 hypothetical protein [Actinomadura luteofluorescens]